MRRTGVRHGPEDLSLQVGLGLAGPMAGQAGLWGDGDRRPTASLGQGLWLQAGLKWCPGPCAGWGGVPGRGHQGLLVLLGPCPWGEATTALGLVGTSCWEQL